MPSQEVRNRNTQTFARSICSQESCIRRRDAIARLMPSQKWCIRKNQVSAAGMHTQGLYTRRKFACARALPSQSVCFRERYARVAALRSQGLCRGKNRAFARLTPQLRIRQINRGCMRMILIMKQRLLLRPHLPIGPWTLGPLAP